MKFRSQIIKPLLGALDTEVLIITAHLFDAFIKDDKVHNKVDEALLIEHGVYLSQELILDARRGFTDANVYRITLFLVLFKTVVPPLHIELLAGQKGTVAQAFRFVSCHAELHRGKEAANERVLLVCKILADAFGHGDTASLQFYDSHSDTVQVDNKIRPLF